MRIPRFGSGFVGKRHRSIKMIPDGSGFGTPCT